MFGRKITKYIRLARTINIPCIYGIFGRKSTKYTVIYGVYIRFWPTIRMLIATDMKRKACKYTKLPSFGKCTTLVQCKAASFFRAQHLFFIPQWHHQLLVHIMQSTLLFFLYSSNSS